jgi:flagellar biosynthetic protein FliR
VLPAGQFNAAKALPKIISMGSKFFVMTIIIAAPVIVGLLLSQILTGFLYKAAPMMNVFFITWPLSIIFGFTLMYLSLPVLEHVLITNFSEIKNEMSQIMALARG